MTAMNSGSLRVAAKLPAEPLEVRGRGGHALLADLDFESRPSSICQLDDRVCLEAGIVAIVPDRLESDVGEGLGVHEKVADAQVLEHRAESLPVVHERFGPPAQLGCGEGRIGAN